jgi:predicted RNA binding protein YcfA (HicA-like mRNA interferase family)
VFGAAIDARHWVGRLHTMKSGDVIKRPESDGWELVRVKGSHHQFRRPGRPGLVTVPHPKAEIPLPTLRSIHRQAGWPWR